MRTRGLIAAPPNSFHTNGTLDLAVIPPLADHLHQKGVSGVFINGTTGEGLSMTLEEREQTAVEWRRVLHDAMKLFVHCGHHSLGDARRLAAHAQTIGADATAVIAPGFFKPDTIESLCTWCAGVAASAPDLPFYFYHMPSMNGVQPRIARFLEAAGPRIPNLNGVKFTFEAMDDYFESMRLANGRYDLLWGRDEMLLGALAMGARGAVGSTFNIAAPLYLDMIQAFDRGDLETARAHQEASIRIIRSLVEHGFFLPALKTALRKQGVPMTPHVRSPLMDAPESILARMDLPR